MCRVLSFVNYFLIWNIVNFFTFARLTLSFVYVMWLLKVDLHLQLLISYDDTSNRFTWRKFRVGENCNFVFLAFFFSIVPFHFVFVVASTAKLIPELTF